MSERVENMSGFIVGELDDCVIIRVEKLLEVREVIFNSLFFIRQSFQVGVFQQAEKLFSFLVAEFSDFRIALASEYPSTFCAK